MSGNIGINIDIDYNGLQAFRTLKTDLRDVAKLMEQKAATAAKAYERNVKSLESANAKLQTKLKGVSTAVDRLKTRLRNKAAETAKANTETKKWTGSLGGIRTAIIAVTAALAAMGIAKVSQRIFETSESFRALKLAMAASAGSAEAGAKEMAFVRAESERLGLELGGTARAYKGILAASEASGRGSEFARRVFLGVAEASKAMALSNEDARGTFLAVQQIISKGKVTAEELRLQLGERFPVAVGVMAQALGVSTAELSKMMEQGLVTADALGPFADLLREKYGKDLGAAMALARAELNRLGNDVTEFNVKIGEAGLGDAYKGVATALRELVATAESSGLAEKLGGAAREIGEAFVILIQRLGPDLIGTLSWLADVITNNVVPTVQFLTHMWQALNGVFQIVSGVIIATVGVLIHSFARLIQLGKLVAEAMGLDGVAEKLSSAEAAVDRLGQEFVLMGVAGVEAGTDMTNGMHRAQIGSEALKAKIQATKDGVKDTGTAGTKAGEAVSKGMKGAAKETKKLGAAAEEAGKKVEETLAKTNPDLHAHMTNLVAILKDTKLAYKELGVTSQTEMQRSSEASITAFNAIREKGGETNERLLEIWQEMKEDVIKEMGALPPAWESTNQEMERLSKEMGPKLLNPYKEFGLKAPAELKKGADAGVAAFRALKEDSDATQAQIASAAEKTQQRLIEAYGAVPPELQPLFASIQTAGVASATAIETAYQRTGRSIGSSIRQGADEAVAALSYVERRAQEVQAAADSSLLNVKIKPIFTSFEDSLVGLQQQLQDALRFRADVANGVIGSGIKGFRDHQLAESAKLIAALEERIAGLKDQGDSANAALGGSSGTSGGGSSSVGGAARPSRPTTSAGIFAPGTDIAAGAGLIPGQFINSPPVREQRESPGPTGFRIPGINFFPSVGEGSLALRRPNSGAAAAEAAASPSVPAESNPGRGSGGGGGRRPTASAPVGSGSITVGSSGGRLPAKDDLDQLDRPDIDGLLVTTRGSAGSNLIQPRTPPSPQATAPQLDSREIAEVVAELMADKTNGVETGSNTTINNPQFTVDIRGELDAETINPRRVVQAILPELRRQIARGELTEASR